MLGLETKPFDYEEYFTKMIRKKKERVIPTGFSEKSIGKQMISQKLMITLTKINQRILQSGAAMTAWE